MRILFISEDSAAAADLSLGLKTAGFSIDHATTCKEALGLVRSTDYDLILIEHSRYINGGTICSNIRGQGRTMPIMVMSADLAVHTKVSLLNAGADDYIGKPCTITELTARVRAMLRRPRSLIHDVLALDDLSIDTQRYTVTRGNKPIRLTKKEFNLLEHLLRHQDMVLSRSALIEHVWDINADLFSNTLETHILNLRKKIEHPKRRKLIHTISGRGYKIALNP